MKFWLISVCLVATATSAAEIKELVCERGTFVNTETSEVYSSSTVFRLKVATDGSMIETEYGRDTAYENVKPWAVVDDDTIFIMYEFDGGNHNLLINRHTGTLYAQEANEKGVFRGEGMCVLPNARF